MAAYRLIYDSRHLQADCQEPGSAPKTYVQQSSMGYLCLFTFTCACMGRRVSMQSTYSALFGRGRQRCGLCLPIIYFASAAVAVDFSHMTASSSASWSRFRPPSDFVNGHVSTMWFIFCQSWPQSQEGDWAICATTWAIDLPGNGSCNSN